MLCVLRGGGWGARVAGAVLIVSSIVVAGAIAGGMSARPAEARDGRAAPAESYYLAVLGLCYRAGAGMFGDALSDQVGSAGAPIIHKAANRDWEDAVRRGDQSITSFCAHAYYAAIGKGYLRRR